MALNFSDKTVTFNGQKQSLDAATATVSEGTTISYATSEDAEEWVSDITELGQTNVGTYTVYVKAENPNYNTATGSAVLRIQPKAVTVTADDKTKVYGTADPDLTATVDGVLGEDKVVYTVSREEGENVGTYTITPSGEKDQGNYTVTYQTGTLTVINNTTDLKFVEADTKGYNGVYDGTAHDGVTSVKVTGVGGTEIKTEDMTVKYRLSDEDEWSSEMPQVTDVVMVKRFCNTCG